MSCLRGAFDSYREENGTLLPTPQQRCRNGRENTGRNNDRFFNVASIILKFTFWTSGYWLSSSCCVMYNIYILLICWFQVVFYLFVVLKYSYFHDRKAIASTIAAQNATKTLASIAGALSYTCMLFFLWVSRRTKKNSIVPYTVFKDLSLKKTTFLFVWIILLTCVYVATVLLFYCIVHDRPKNGNFVILAVGVGSQFVAEWTGIISCFVFGASTLAVGTFSKDTFRRIKDMREQDIDSAIKIYKELSCIVSDTVQAYCPWFIFHWLLYGITTIISLVVVVNHFGETVLVKKIYVGLFFIIHCFLFVFPCGCAAYVTSACAAIASKVNNTTAEDWNENHLFRNRQSVQLFVSYAHGSPICFKIGRITFTSTLAWCSFFFGSAGLLFRFFK